MTVTTTEAAPAESGTPVPAAVLPPPRGLAALLATNDHKVIGRLWVGTSLLFLVATAALGTAVGAEKIDTADIDVLGTDSFGQLFSLYDISLVFLVALPLLIGLGTAIVPLQVGSPSVAFPRAAAAAFWGWFLGTVTVFGAYIANGGPFGGERDAVSLFIAAMVVVVLSLLLGAICVATTALALRAPGLSLRRTPLFSWSTIVAAGVWTLTLPVVAGLLVLVYVDHRYGPAFLAGNTQVYARLSWVWHQPTLYALAVPALGIVADIVPVAARRRLRLHVVGAGLIGAFGVLGFGAWAMPGFTYLNGPFLDQPYRGEPTYVAVCFLAVIPLLGLAGQAADTLRQGSVRAISPLFFAVAALLMLLAGAANGALVSIEDLDLANTTAEFSQRNYVLFAVAIAAAGGIVYWAPKLLGAKVAEGAAKGLAALMLVGTVVYCLPDLISGFVGQLDNLGPATDDVDTVEALNVVSTIGAGLLTVTFLAFALLVAKAAVTRDPDLGADPWEGNTLEWVTPSPPPPGNFGVLPEIASEAPLYDARFASEDDA